MLTHILQNHIQPSQIYSVRKCILTHSLYSHKKPREVSTCREYQKTHANSLATQPEARGKQMHSVRKHMLTHLLSGHKQWREMSRCRVSENISWLTSYTATTNKEGWANAECQKTYADLHATQPQATKKDKQMHSVIKFMLPHSLYSHKKTRKVSICRISENACWLTHYIATSNQERWADVQYQKTHSDSHPI